MKYIAAGPLALLVLATPACLGPFDLRQTPPPTVDTSALVEGNTRFALSLYTRLRGGPGNLLFSPYSISTAVAMTSAGARGKTLEQMEAVLGLPRQDQLHPALAYLGWQLTQKQRGVELHTANALWVQQELRFRPEFLGLMRTHHRTGLQLADFVFDAEQARQAVNAWAAKQTNDRIQGLIPPGVLDSSTRLLLANAVHFKGRWQKRFRKEDTAPGNFTLADGKTGVPLPMMRQKAEFAYLQEGNLQALELPYVGGSFGMMIVLPARADGLPELERSLTPQNLARWLSALRPRAVHVGMPRFQMAHSVDLRSALFHMGMSLAFGPGADFTGMDGGKEGLFLSAAVHKAAIEVHEEGTEAAAATGVAVAARSADATPHFTVDRPFVFLIRDRRTGTILFLGRVADPRA
jgi:serpin B